MSSLHGSCLCGAISYEVTGPFDEMHHCHCSRCRKAHGAAFSTFARTAASRLHVRQGGAAIRHYRSSPQVERSFCGICGSNLFFRFDVLPDVVWVAVGTIDGDPGMRPQAHIFAEFPAPWHAILDELPQFPGHPPDETEA
jgi:hypothetical protein